MSGETGDKCTGLRIRPAQPADYRRIVEVWTAAGLSTRPGGRDAPQEFLRQLGQFPTTYLVGELNEKIVGVVFGTHDGRKGWINRLAVHPVHRRRGIASALVEACDEAVRACGIDIVAALIEPENSASLALFKALGYVDDAPVVYVRKLGRADI